MNNEQCYQQFLDNNLYPRELKDYSTKKLINFSSNDYLGLSNHPLLIARAQEFAQKYGVGSTSSRLVAGNISVYETLEKNLAKAIGKPAALILGTGFQTNTSVLPALLDTNVLSQEPLVFADRLCHISILLGARAAARVQRFQHNDLNHLERLLKKICSHNTP